MMQEIKFTIPLDPATKKNSSRIVSRGKFKKLLPSEKFEDYQNSAGYYIPAYAKQLMIDYPVNIKAIYYRKHKYKVDITNLHSALHDVLVTYRVLSDDSSINPCIVFSTDGSRVNIDYDNPRTEVTITIADGM